MPDFIIIGGPNGAGKSTIFPAINSSVKVPGSYEPEVIDPENFVNADTIARDNNLNDIAAARVALERVDELIQSGKSIAVESTLSGNWLIHAIKRARSNGYRVYIFYILIESSELSMVRVTQRALLGKHYISMQSILTRFSRSLSNFFNKYKPLADFWLISDNSSLMTKPLIWGGNIYHNENYYCTSSEDLNKVREILFRNKVAIGIDSDYLNLNDTYTPIVIRNVQKCIEAELSNRPKGNYIAISENFNIRFVRYR